MGNCLRHESTGMIVDDDDTVYWEETEKAGSVVEKHKLIQSSKVIKIKISRKEFEAVMRGEEKDDSFLSRLVSVADVTTVASKTWRPVLYSIPEMD